MRSYFEKDPTRGDFSTSFADMIFGLLFFFFILTLAMVFNRTDVSLFQKESDKLREEIARQEKALEQWKKKHDELRRRLEQWKEREAELRKELAKRSKTQEVMEKKNRSVVESLAVTQDEYNRLLDEYNRLTQKILQSEEMVQRLKREEKPRPPKESPKESEESEKAVKELGKRLQAVKKKHDAVAKQLKETTDRLEKIKNLLRQKGLVDILAEIERMENPEPKEEKKPQGEDNPENVYKIWVKLYPEEYMDVRVARGESDLEENFNVSADDLVNVAARVMDRYKAEIQMGLGEEDKKNRPRVFLMAHPEARYGSVQEVLAKVRKVMGVSITAWKDEK